ncbi:hypothetical protein ACFQ2B_40550 [Streptomyces stramineus]
MQIIDGHQYGTRQDLVEHTGYSTATLSDFWKDRVSNGHPPARIIDGVMHWDVDEWDRWYAEFQRTRRNAAKPIDRSGDPDEELRPADQARVLGLPRNMIAQYRKKPPNGWPKPTRVEDLPAAGCASSVPGGSCGSTTTPPTGSAPPAAVLPPDRTPCADCCRRPGSTARPGRRRHRRRLGGGARSVRPHLEADYYRGPQADAVATGNRIPRAGSARRCGT